MARGAYALHCNEVMRWGGLPWRIVIAGVGGVSDDGMTQGKHVYSELMTSAAGGLEEDLGRRSTLK